MSRGWFLAVVLTLAVAPAVVLTAQQTTPPQIRSTDSFQVIVFLVDLQIPSGEPREQAVAAAERVVQNSWERWNVGLEQPHLFAVKTLGARVETIQEFTWNPDLIYAALDTAARQPSPATNELTGRTESVAGMCGALAQVTPNASLFAGLRVLNLPEIAPASTPRAVYYFGNFSNGSFAEASSGTPVLPSACRQPNVFFLFAVASRFSLTSRTSPPPVGVSVRIVPHQAGSPVSIVESTSDLEDGYASVVLRDDADKAIRSVTLAALVRPTDPAMTTPQVFTRRGPSVILLPRATTGIAVQLIDPSTLDAFARKGANVELGVVGVEFADGSTWSYDLAAKGRFERH